jgi:ADP-heptose:LPS heptosyltransferase
VMWPSVLNGRNRLKTAPEKILVCRLDHIGDIVMTTPAFRALKEKFPLAKLFVLTNEAGISILRENPYIDGFFSYNWPWPYDLRNNKFTWQHFRKLVKLAGEIRKMGFHIFIDFRGDVRMLLVWGVCSFIPVRVFYNRIGGKSLATHAADHKAGMHELERVNATLASMNLSKYYNRGEIHLVDEDYFQAEQKLKLINVSFGQQEYVVISPFAAKEIKEWQLLNWKKVIQHITDSYELDIYVIGTNDNYQDGENLAGNVQAGFNLCGKTSLREVSAIISKARLVLGVDTGTLHIASCFDVPVVALFGPTDSNQYRPYGPFCEVIDLDICTCDKNKHLVCTNPKGTMPYCLSEISPQLVCNKADSLLTPKKAYG